MGWPTVWSTLAAICLLLAHAVDYSSSQCTSGFMSLDVIQKRAEKIPNGGSVPGTRLSNEFRLIPDWTFTCDGSITTLLLGADIQTPRSAVSYPEVQIWRRSGSGMNQFNKVASRQITLVAGDFTPTGVFQYQLTPPLPFQSGDVLGIYHPEQSGCDLRIYYKNDNTAPTAYGLPYNPDTVTIPNNNLFTYTNQFILISLITDPPCGSGFLSFDAIRNKALNLNINRVTRRENQVRIFPDINFTCRGNLTKWIVGGVAGASVGAELQIWRNTGGSDYTKVGSSVVMATDPDNDNVYEYSPVPPLEFHEGDILGVYQDGGSSMRVFYQENTGPPYYRMNYNQQQSLSLSSLQNNEFDYPLVTVEIATSSSITSTVDKPVISSPTAIYVQSSTTSITGTQSKSLTIPPTTQGGGGGRVTSAFTPSSSKTPIVPTNPSDAPNIGPAIGAIIMIVLVLVLITVVAIIIIIVLRKTKKNHQRKKSNPLRKPLRNSTDDLGSFYNPVYDASTKEQVVELSEQDECYSFYDASYTAPHPASIMTNLQQDPHVLPGHLSWGIIVPTLAQRQAFVSMEESGKMTPAELYAAILKKEASPYEIAAQSCNTAHGHYEAASSGYDQLRHTVLFSEEPVYWEPGSDCNSIYEQLSQQHFREIFQQQIKITNRIGSGQFGVVNKGVWVSPMGHQPVAIKMLKDGASEEEKVKFLQEAAIMGQFHHPNVVKLHGVVTLGDPIMIVIELMDKKDLLHLLHSLRPNPGELPPATLPQQLLDYCHQIASGMEYLSRKCFVHRDLAARNILVDQNKCKIADFGMSRDLQNKNYYMSRGGQIPVKWTAPEALQFKKYSTASDVWSFGVLMYEIWSLGRKPFEKKTNPQAFKSIQSGVRLPPPPGCTRPLYEIMIQCWHPNTARRPSFTELVSRLSQSHENLLKWSEIAIDDPQAILGSPLSTSTSLYLDLQQIYLK